MFSSLWGQTCQKFGRVSKFMLGLAKLIISMSCASSTKDSGWCHRRNQGRDRAEPVRGPPALPAQTYAKVAGCFKS